MTNARPTPSRRDVLTGRAVRQQVEHAGEQIADALVEAGEHRPAPVASDTVRLETSAMACQWSVVLNPGPPRQVMAASDALDIVHALESQLTVYRDDSELMELNRSARPVSAAERQPFVAEVRLFDLLVRCQEWAAETGGAFDPTSGPLIALWRTHRERGEIPTAVKIASILKSTGIDRVQFDPQTCGVQLPLGFFFDLASVGKGYAIDRAADHLRAEQIPDFLIHGGHSSLYAAGRHGGHDGWPVGIKNPLLTNRRYATLLLRDQGMSTSGSNIQYFRYQGRRYGHILDPRTGWPAHSPEVESGPTDSSKPSPDEHAMGDALLSVTVLAPTAAEADALSTAFYVMGLEKAREYCHNHPLVSAILIPPPARGRTLEPVVCNLAEDQLFFDETAVNRIEDHG